MVKLHVNISEWNVLIGVYVVSLWQWWSCNCKQKYKHTFYHKTGGRVQNHTGLEPMQQYFTSNWEAFLFHCAGYKVVPKNRLTKSLSQWFFASTARIISVYHLTEKGATLIFVYIWQPTKPLEHCFKQFGHFNKQTDTLAKITQGTLESQRFDDWRARNGIITTWTRKHLDRQRSRDVNGETIWQNHQWWSYDPITRYVTGEEMHH